MTPGLNGVRLEDFNRMMQFWQEGHPETAPEDVEREVREWFVSARRTEDEKRADQVKILGRLRRTFPNFDWEQPATLERTINRMTEDGVDPADLYWADEGMDVGEVRCTACRRLVAILVVPGGVDVGTKTAFRRYAYWDIPRRVALKRGRQYVSPDGGKTVEQIEQRSHRVCKHRHRLEDPETMDAALIAKQRRHRKYRLVLKDGFVPVLHPSTWAGGLYRYTSTPTL